MILKDTRNNNYKYYISLIKQNGSPVRITENKEIPINPDNQELSGFLVVENSHLKILFEIDSSSPIPKLLFISDCTAKESIKESFYHTRHEHVQLANYQ